MFEIICGVSGVLGKGMLIEQVQKILGSEQIDTTLRYAGEAEEELPLLFKEVFVLLRITLTKKY